MQYFKHNAIIFITIFFWLVFFGIIYLIDGLFSDKEPNPIIVYDITEGGLKNQLHLKPHKFSSNKIPSNIEKGKNIFVQCAICHSLNSSEIRIGPNLNGIIDKNIASNNKFIYSSAMYNFAKQKKIWSSENLNKYIENPQKIVPGNKMAFVGISNAESRKNLILYLKQKK